MSETLAGKSAQELGNIVLHSQWCAASHGHGLLPEGQEALALLVQRAAAGEQDKKRLAMLADCAISLKLGMDGPETTATITPPEGDEIGVSLATLEMTLDALLHAFAEPSPASPSSDMENRT